MENPRRRRRLARILAATTLALGIGSFGVAQVAGSPDAFAAPPGEKDVTAVMFEWSFASVARECATTLGPLGYGFVQVSPPQEHIQGSQWWTSYQPVSYAIAGRLGNRAAFANMVDACHAAGVKVIVDTVINHMSAGAGTGTGGTRYSKYHYPGVYSDADFHSCRSPINDYTNRGNVQDCELVSLSDLNTGSDQVRNKIAGYMNDLTSLGVDGFRIDAAKHMSAADLAAIKSKLSNTGAYWKQEAIHGAGEAVQPSEYTGSGDVQEFRFARDLKRVFLNENLAYLSNFGASWGYLPSNQAAVFVDNHDTERVGDTLSYKNGSAYALAQVFTLAWPYGAPDVNSGYEFSSHDAGPPNNGTVTACYADGWKCQHAWRQVGNMVGFRNAVRGTAVTNWWSNGADQIAFSRGNRGYVAINHEGSSLTRTFQTSLPAGTYCDVQHGDPTGNGGCTGTTYAVNSSGQFTATIAAGEAVALHVGARGVTPTASASPTPTSTAAAGAGFNVTATTSPGQNIFVVGNQAALGAWAPAGAVPLSATGYPVWKGAIALPAGTAFEYKYIRKNSDGSVTWESGANRTATVPAGGQVTLNDTWR
ncbi:carbohydrate-binding module family 20 domain-containing protein [Actinoplanes sp. NEAU-A12]|uniref:Alpha-amylase n=1 Tax=Actinoplanes sandaracinus TaxID=3045177 RepID=A0ABT6WQT7_9ACTN|nr:carbohydrate-binding module family 20 domain-containing protein [Actinoplanes sandaracinus]MDI6102100.1 carbohydrate-binding module family 20 domain-containing protein [Actinoplanes sandaracinus]